MRDSRPSVLAHFALAAALVALCACSPKRIPPMTVSELLEDRVMLDGVLMKCDARPAQARDDQECQNAHEAIARLVKDPDPDVVARRTAAFERAREQRRQALDKMRAQQESQAKVDAYSLPVLPVNPAEAASAAGAPGASAAPTDAPPADGATQPPAGEPAKP